MIDDGYTTDWWPLFEVDADHGSTTDVSVDIGAVSVGYGQFVAEVRWCILIFNDELKFIFVFFEKK